MADDAETIELAESIDVAETSSEGEEVCVAGVSDRETYTNWLSSIDEHFVCHQGGIPEVDEDDWSVSLAGDIDDTDLSVAELRTDYPRVSVAHTMECAGNSRSFFEPTTGSPEWEIGGVHTAVWRGAPLRSVLERNGLKRNGLDAADGTDKPTDDRWLTAIGGEPPSDGTVFARSIPLSKALDDCILAYGMNGQPLPDEHGAPVRLIVPGWYGVNSVKWVTELRVMDKMVCGEEWRNRDGYDVAHWQQTEYRITPKGEEPAVNDDIDTYDTWDQFDADGVTHPYPFDTNVKSLIGHPDGEEPIQPRGDGNVEVLGLAWAGDDDVESVEISTDGGETWDDATFFGPAYPGAWRLFRYLWNADPGEHTLVSRATDEQGRTQPAHFSEPVENWDEADEDEYPWNEGCYGGNAYMPHAVDVTVEKRD